MKKIKFDYEKKVITVNGNYFEKDIYKAEVKLRFESDEAMKYQKATTYISDSNGLISWLSFRLTKGWVIVNE